MIYLDKFMHEICNRYNYPEIMVDLMCNTCYQGLEGDQAVFRHEDVFGLGQITENLKIVVQELCVNSLYGVLEILATLVDFLMLITSIDPDEATRLLPVKDVKRMVDLFTKYKLYFGGTEFELEYSFSQDNGLSILESIKSDLDNRLGPMEDVDEDRQGDFTKCQKFFRAGTFFEDCCLMVREIFQEGLFKNKESLESKLRLFYQQVGGRFPKPRHLKRREMNPNRQPIKANSTDFDIIKDLYKELENPRNIREKRFFNKALVFSGMHSEAFTDCLISENKKRSRPDVFQNEAFVKFDGILDRANVLHGVELDDFQLSNEIYIAIRDGLKKLRTYTPPNVAKPPQTLHLQSPRSVGPVIPPHARNFRNFVSEVPTKTTTTTTTTTTSGITVGYLLLFLGLLLGVFLFLA